MFENSVHAGMAGHCQWGLDAGEHQGKWHPYGGLNLWSDATRDGPESELEVCAPLELQVTFDTCSLPFISLVPTTVMAAGRTMTLGRKNPTAQGQNPFLVTVPGLLPSRSCDAAFLCWTSYIILSYGLLLLYNAFRSRSVPHIVIVFGDELRFSGTTDRQNTTEAYSKLLTQVRGNDWKGARQWTERCAAVMRKVRGNDSKLRGKHQHLRGSRGCPASFSLCPSGYNPRVYSTEYFHAKVTNLPNVKQR
jgi:hypothetical protein